MFIMMMIMMMMMMIIIIIINIIIIIRVTFHDTKLAGYTLERQTASLTLNYWEL